MVRPTVAGAIANALLITAALIGINIVHSKTHTSSPTLREYATNTVRPNFFVAIDSGSTSELDDLEQTAIAQVNQYRDRQGLPPLATDEVLREQARLHSEAMASGRIALSHEGFGDRIRVIAQRIPYGGAAENVAFNQGYDDPVDRAVEGWLRSEGHRRNILGDYDLTGMGIAKGDDGGYYFTQIFVRRR